MALVHWPMLRNIRHSVAHPVLSSLCPEPSSLPGAVSSGADGQLADARSFATSSCRPQSPPHGPEAAPHIPIRKLLVANRGEIACRVLRTAKRLGIPTVAVYSEADRAALHVQHADEAFCVGPAAAKDSYLRMDRILEVALRTGASAVHPGYGFLSENTEFSRACEDHGIAFVGPPASAIAAMGNKSEAKALMVAAGVPVVPGYHGEDQALSTLLEQGRETVGFPLLVKAVLGGGGKGMKLAASAAGLEEAIRSARREARAAFGDERVLLERYVRAPRHIEVQVFADAAGNAVHLFERDCSMQRRHQKVIEEAPAPSISGAFRRALGGAAVAAARAVGYVNAGTVEFIVDTATGAHFFMEMNTRLQVEHPVTEAITGLDLVEWQLRVAAGQPLPLQQDQLHIQGHAVEARLYAESPERGFLPGAGTLRRWRPPRGALAFARGGDLRMDAGVREGDEVGVNYDPMIAKLIAKGPDRATALANLHAGLSELQVSGLPTNVEFLKRLCAHPAFAACDLDTSFIERHLDELLERTPPSAKVLALAAITDHLLQVRAAEDGAAGRRGDPWAVLDGFRLNHELTTPSRLAVRGAAAQGDLRLTFHKDASITVQGTSGDGAEGAWQVTARGMALSADGSSVEGEVGGQRLRADVSAYSQGDEQVVTLWVGTNCFEFARPVPREWAQVGGATMSAGTVRSPMPGKIIKVLVAEGEHVQAGAPLVVLEAMKMEHTVAAPCAGTVSQLGAHPGAQVADGEVLAVVAPIEVADAAAAG